MKAPDLAIVDDAGVHPWTGATDPLKAAAAHAHLKFAVANLAHAKDRATLFAELDRALKLPEHFGHNFDARWPTSCEDSDWLGKSGRVLALAHAADYRKEHPNGLGDARGPFSAKLRSSGRNATSGFWTFVRLKRSPNRPVRPMKYKQPVSVLRPRLPPDRTVLVIERADYPEHWQSVTGSQEPGSRCARRPSANCARKQASTRALRRADRLGVCLTCTKYFHNGGTAIRPARPTTPSTCSRSKYPHPCPLP